MALDIHQIEQAERNSLNWLVNAYTKHGSGGFPHSRWMYLPSYFAWKRDYAETTGYLLENLVDRKEPEYSNLNKIAYAAGDWLLKIQNTAGYFYSGVEFKSPSIFNTAQVLFGFDTLFTSTQENKYFDGIEKAHNWMINALDENGKFNIGLYYKDFYSCYYSRALWPLLLIDRKYFQSKNVEKIIVSIDLLFSNKNNKNYFNDCGFYPNGKSLSHSTAYTIEGFLECALILRDEIKLEYLLKLIDLFCDKILISGKTPGFYLDDLSEDNSFVCITGEAQFCCLMIKAFQLTGQKKFLYSATILFKNLLRFQIQSSSSEHQGAFPSSIPIWKDYFPFRYTNWTIKFFLDACEGMKKYAIVKG